MVYPCVGAVVSLFKGYDAGYKGLIPPYIVLTEPQGRFSEAGFLGSRYKPFATGGDPAAAGSRSRASSPQGITDERQKSRRELLHQLDTLGRAMPGDPRLKALDQCEEQAYDLILGDAGKLFDLSQEKDELRERYGRNTFGQSCLMARRLVEHGVPYVTINYKGWDTHKQHFQIMRRKLPELDKGLATLLQDLSDRGLLDSTIVWWSGEFGRTPKVQWEAPWNGGRNHFGNGLLRRASPAADSRAATWSARRTPRARRSRSGRCIRGSHRQHVRTARHRSGDGPAVDPPGMMLPRDAVRAPRCEMGGPLKEIM